jgi:predicted Zn-dependent protease with MMP-like domain
LSSVQESVLNKLSEYEDAGIARDEALSTAIADVAEDLGTTEDNILAQIGTPATGDAAATGIYAALDNNTDAILEILGAPATDDTAATGIYGYIDSAVNSLGTDLAALAGNVGTAAEYDADGNLLTEATGIYAQVDALMAQGMTNAEAIASLAVEFGVAVTDLTNLINDQTSTITEDVGEVAEDVSDIAGLLGKPAVADNPLTEEDESTDPTGLFGIIAGYETAGQERDEAIDSAISDLAEQLGTTKTDILDQLNLGLDQIETLITNSQTGLEEKIDKAVEDIGVDIGDMETEILDKMAEYELAGIDRDEALTTAISDLATELGLTEEALLDQITSTETNLLTELGLTEEFILDRINEAETSLSDQIIETETNLSGEIDAVAALVGKAAQEVTQADIDFVADIIAQAEVINDAKVIQQYDVTGDGVIDINDQTLLESILAGDTDVTVADTSIFAPTGVYDAISDTETALQEDIDQTQDQITEMEQNIQTNIEQEAVRAGLRDFLGMAMESPDMGGQQVTVKTPDPMRLNYLYDFSSIFANPTQQNLFPSPYAKGGQVEDTTDKLLRIIGGS